MSYVRGGSCGDYGAQDGHTLDVAGRSYTPGNPENEGRKECGNIGFRMVLAELDACEEHP
jgi:hypothetical protein